MPNISARPFTQDEVRRQAASQPGVATRIPRSLTSFIGREREVEAGSKLLTREDVRLLTLTGPGGVGKTRMALQVASSVDAFPGGIWFVDLASVYDPALVAAAIARTLGIHQVTDQSIEQAIVDFLHARRALLILDNFEQIIPAGPMLTELLSSCIHLKLLVTSRVPLRVSGEHVYMVPPLALPDGTEAVPLDRLLGIDSVRLFVDRARGISSDFDLTSENAAAVTEVCRRLDGVPLAIELAAARANVLTPASMLKRLDERLAVLATGPRDAPDRLRSMRDSISWSYDLLSPGERQLFRQLGVLVGSWTLDAAEAVAGSGDDRSRHVVFERLAALVDASLVRRHVEGNDDVSTYRMLVTIQAFAEELLDRSDEAEAVHHRHVAFLTDLAERTEVALYLPDGDRLIAHMRIHVPNIRKALVWLERQHDVERMLHLTGSLIMFWTIEGQLHEGRRWLERAVALGRTADSRRLGKALASLGFLVHMQGEEALALALCEEGMSLLEDSREVKPRFLVYTLAGLIALRTGDLDRAVESQERALDLLRTVPQLDWARYAESTLLGHLGNLAVARGNIDDAERFFEQALARQRALGHAPGTSHVMASHPIAGLGDVARARSDLEAARAHYRQALSLAIRYHDSRAIAYALGGVAGTLAAAGRWREASRLFGAAEAWHEQTGFHFQLETMDRQRALGLPEPWLRADAPFESGQPLRNALWSHRDVPLPPLPDPTAAAEQWQAGRALSIEDATALALRDEVDPDTTAETAGGLSAREREVLKLLVEGLSDQEIGDALFISRRTVATHIRHIYDKLGVSSRASATAWAVRHGLD